MLFAVKENLERGKDISLSFHSCYDWYAVFQNTWTEGFEEEKPPWIQWKRWTKNNRWNRRATGHYDWSLYIQTEGHVTACSEETGREGKAQALVSLLGITIKVVQGRKLWYNLQKRKASIREEHIWRQVKLKLTDNTGSIFIFISCSFRQQFRQCYDRGIEYLKSRG